MVERTRRQSNITQYFSGLIILFGCLSLALNLHISKEINLGDVQQFLMESFTESLTANIAGLSRPIGQAEAEGADEGSAERNEHGDQGHSLAGLNCDAHGGPSEEAAREMVYWSDIPSDSKHVSPFKRKNGPTQYLTFEPDQGGWNNIRMSMETVLAMSFAMGR